MSLLTAFGLRSGLRCARPNRLTYRRFTWRSRHLQCAARAVAYCALFLAALAPLQANAEITLWITNVLGYGDVTPLFPYMRTSRAAACRQTVAQVEEENARWYDIYASQGDESLICPGQIE